MEFHVALLYGWELFNFSLIYAYVLFFFWGGGEGGVDPEGGPLS